MTGIDYRGISAADDDFSGIRLVLITDVSLKDLSRIASAVDTLFRNFSLANSDRPSSTRSVRDLQQRTYPWNAVDGLQVHRATHGSIEFLTLVSSIVKPGKAIRPLVGWIKRNVDPLAYEDRTLEVRSRRSQVERLEAVNANAAVIDGYDLEDRAISVDRNRVQLFSEVLTNVYDPLIQRGFSHEQALRAANIASENFDALMRVQARAGAILSVESTSVVLPEGDTVD